MSWRGPHHTIYAISNKSKRFTDETVKPDIECLFYGDIKDIETPEQFMLRQEEATLLRRALERLYPREERVIRLWWGIDGEEMTLDQIGEQFGVTRERVRQISAKAERKLLRFLREDFPDRYRALAKKHGWGRVPPSLVAETQAKLHASSQERYETWLKEKRGEEERQQERERLANLKATELSRLEVERIRAQNVRPLTLRTGFYVPRLIDPRTGAWEWVEITREVYDASAA